MRNTESVGIDRVPFDRSGMVVSALAPEQDGNVAQTSCQNSRANQLEARVAISVLKALLYKNKKANRVKKILPYLRISQKFAGRIVESFYFPIFNMITSSLGLRAGRLGITLWTRVLALPALPRFGKHLASYGKSSAYSVTKTKAVSG